MVPFDRFADGLIEATGLTWTAPDMSRARKLLHSAIRRAVVDVLENYGAVDCTYRPNRLLPELKDLETFEITSFGATLLDSLVIQES